MPRRFVVVYSSPTGGARKVAEICELIRKRAVLMNEKPQAKFFTAR